MTAKHDSSEWDDKIAAPEPAAWHRVWPWIAIAGMAVLSFVLGYLGFEKHAAAVGNGDGGADLLYRTLQLFVLESGYLGTAIPWQLEVARWIAPLVPAWAALQALRVLFRDQREAFWLRRRRNHVIICGLGRKGLQLVRDFRKIGDDVVVIERDADNSRVTTCRRLGARVLLGNCKDATLLRKVRADRASYIVVVTGDDGTNVETAILIHQLIGERDRRTDRRIRCFVHVVDLKLCRLLERNDLLSAPAAGLTTRIFNSYQNSARSLLETNPLEPAGFRSDDPRGVHLVVFGFGQMGEAVVLQAAKLGHFANGEPLRITVIDETADERQASFENRYPQVKHIRDLDLQFIRANEESRDILSRLEEWATDSGSITSIAVCLDGDSPSLTCALNVVATLGPTTVPIHVRMSQGTGLATLLGDRPGMGDCPGTVQAFGMTSFNATRSLLLNPKRDALARVFQDGYVEKNKHMSKKRGSLAMQDWDSLPVDMRDSNRQTADHLAVKLRMVGCHEDDGDLTKRLVDLEAGEIEVLARMEHARWCAERFIAGWRYGATDRDRKIHADLVPWGDLGEDSREYNRVSILGIPAALKRVEAEAGA